MRRIARASPILAWTQGVYRYLGLTLTLVDGLEMSANRPWDKNEKIWPLDELASIG